MTELLYLNKILVDLKGKSLTRKIQIGDVGDIASRKSTFSYTLKLPRTTNTVRMLDMLGVPSNTSRKPFELVSADYIVDGIPLVLNGFGKIRSSDSDIEINIFDGVKDLSERLKGKKISDLPLSDLDHILTTQQYINSFSHTEGYIYGLANYGLGLSTSVKVEKQAPSIFIHTLFRKIFESNGLNLIGEFFTTNEKYLNEVVTPAKGYEVLDAAFSSTTKGGADTNTLSDYSSSQSWIEFDRKFDFTDIGLVGASVVGGDIVFSVVGTYKINIDTSYSSYLTYMNLEFKINDAVKASVYLQEGENSKITDIVFTVEAGDVLSLHLVGSSNYLLEEGDFQLYEVNYSVSCDTLLYLQEGGQLIQVSDYIGDLSQINLVKDVITRYGLVLHPISNSVDYEFKRLEVLLSDRASAEDWTKKISRIGKESYDSGYAQINKAVYNYPESIVVPNNDGEMLIDNQNAAIEKTFIASSFEIPNTLNNISGNLIYSIPIWELKDSVIELQETPLKLMSIERIDLSITAKLFDEVTGITSVLNNPFLSLANISMNYFVGNYYRAFRSLINNYKEVDFVMNLSIIDIFNLDFFRLKYLKQTGRFYYLDSVTHRPNRLSKVKMIEIAEFPQNQPPSQIGNFAFDMNHDSTRTITLANLKTGYEDPETDEPLKIKIISGFDGNLIMKNNGVLIDSETEILVADLNLTVFDSLGGLSGYSVDYEFTIADIGSGEYSEQTGTLTANVLAFTNFPPVANAGSDQEIELPPLEFQEDTFVNLNGSASHDDTGEIISYVWSLESKPLGTNAFIDTQNTSTPTASLIVPNELNSAGVYELKLTVTDEFGASDTDIMNVDIDMFHP